MTNAWVVKPEDVPQEAMLDQREEIRHVRAVERRIFWPGRRIPIKTFVASTLVVEPDVKTPMHRHNCEEGYYIIEGSGYLQVEDGKGGWDRLEFRQGDGVFIRENVKHRVVSGPDGNLRYISMAGHILEPWRDEWGEIFPEEG